MLVPCREPAVATMLKVLPLQLPAELWLWLLEKPGSRWGWYMLWGVQAPQHGLQTKLFEGAQALDEWFKCQLPVSQRAWSCPGAGSLAVVAAWFGGREDSRKWL